MPKTVPAELGLDSFSCPHCGALAHQTWYRTLIDRYQGETRPAKYVYSKNTHERLLLDAANGHNIEAAEFAGRLKHHTLTDCALAESEWCKLEMMNLAINRCYSCDGYSLWVSDKLVYPQSRTDIPPHEHMPEHIKVDFEEAAAIVDRSPRGAAALLRLCIQKIMPTLGEGGTNINADIKSLVTKGVEPDIARALDILRVIGNEAVHPGTMDLKDDKATALKLFDILNIIVDNQIARPAKVAALYRGLPADKLAAIERRDAPTANEDKRTDGDQSATETVAVAVAKDNQPPTSSA